MKAALCPSQPESRTAPPLSRTRFPSSPAQLTVPEPLSNHTNFKSTLRPGGRPRVQLQAGTAADWWWAGWCVWWTAAEGPGEERWMRPAGCLSRATCPPQRWSGKANVLSEEREREKTTTRWHESLVKFCVMLQEFTDNK